MAFLEKKYEPLLKEVSFNVHKLSVRPRSSPDNTIIICCFSEFGCEMIGAMYAIPKVIRDNPDMYVVVAGWYGRQYLYEHLADEYWEIKEEYQHLREYCRAFHHTSKTLAKLEEKLAMHGRVWRSEWMSNYFVADQCRTCNIAWVPDTKSKLCPRCHKSDRIERAIFSDTEAAKKSVVRIPYPSVKALANVSSMLGKNMVGVFARGRAAYGRNLQPEFYVKLIKLLESRGYTPIWLGEKQSTQPCPVSHVADFSRMTASRDLEQTLAVISQCKFTVQFWTASSRLAGIMGVPYLIFESPDQIVGAGQEGYRINLTTFGPKKLVYSHYRNVYENNDGAIELVGKAVSEMESENWEHIIGMVDQPGVVEEQIRQGYRRIGWQA